ncbi:MAG: methionyl-tRNA formyltransferase [Ruminococcaceae bacterium]|nr:methionyl-tRNA formyltransferase [Oscillospiraceae bacterium]
MRNIVFMGTGPFALEALTGLYESLSADDRLSVYTKESKKAGRGMKEKDGPVALYAKEKGLPLYQPATLRTPEAQEEFAAIGADLAIVASYGLILPKAVLDTPKHGCINIHASLLPRYRGAAPINRAIMDGEALTGVTLQQMDEGLDTGDILSIRETPIGETECAGELFDRLAVMGKEMMLELLPDVFAGTLKPIPQNHNESTYAAKITKEDQRVDFSRPTAEILDRIRGLCPIPSAFCYTKKDGKLLKLHEAERADGSFSGEVGQIVEVKPRVVVKTSDGAIFLNVIQPEGKGKMNARDAVNGRKLEQGDLLI